MYIPSNFGNDYKRRQISPLTEIFNSVSFEVDKKLFLPSFCSFVWLLKRGVCTQGIRKRGEIGAVNFTVQK